MFKQESPSQSNVQNASIKIPRKKYYAFVTGIIMILVIVTTLFVPQGSGSPMELNLNYSVGEHMVYHTTNTVTNRIVNTSLAIPG